LPLHLRRESLLLHQRIHVDKPGGGLPSRIEVDLRLRAENNQTFVGAAILPKEIRNLNRFRKGVPAVAKSASVDRGHPKEVFCAHRNWKRHGNGKDQKGDYARNHLLRCRSVGSCKASKQ
jgi:hypothetical protein